MKELLVILMWSVFYHFGDCTILTPREKLRNIVDNNTYDINEWPHAKENRSTDVFTQLFINSFGSLNAANMDYSLDTFLRQRWTDKRLAFGGDIPSITITEKGVQDKIWKPDTFFENVKDASLHKVTVPNVLLRISNKGGVLYSMRISAKFACNMDFNKYPFDEQICHVKIASYANTMDVIQYKWTVNKPIDIPENLEISQFDFIKNETTNKNYTYATGNFSGLHVKFFLARQKGYHILQTYIPTIMIVAISWVSFWLDPNAVPGRVSLGVTTLLTLTTLASGIRQQLPPVSYVKAIDVWVGMCMIMVFGALLEFTLVNWMANRKIPPGKRPCTIPKCLMVCSVGVDAEQEDKENSPTHSDSPLKSSPTTYIDHARAFDRVCRVFFPASFLLFNLGYWPFYLSHDYSAVT